jgi:enoyl-CoA hydratase/carnithine racemase
MDHVLYEKKGKIAYITLNRPEKLNALGLQATKELAEIWKDFRDDSDVWVGILSGKGRSFCAGADVGKMDLGKEGKWTIDKSLILGEHRMGPSNYRVWKPLIAAVHRHVLGAGFYLAMECDIRIASEDAEFGLPEPMVGMTILLAEQSADFALKLSGRAYILEKGAICWSGNTSELEEKPEILRKYLGL